MCRIASTTVLACLCRLFSSVPRAFGVNLGDVSRRVAGEASLLQSGAAERNEQLESKRALEFNYVGGVGTANVDADLGSESDAHADAASSTGTDVSHWGANESAIDVVHRDFSALVKQGYFPENGEEGASLVCSTLKPVFDLNVGECTWFLEPLWTGVVDSWRLPANVTVDRSARELQEELVQVLTNVGDYFDDYLRDGMGIAGGARRKRTVSKISSEYVFWPEVLRKAKNITKKIGDFAGRAGRNIGTGFKEFGHLVANDTKSAVATLKDEGRAIGKFTVRTAASARRAIVKVFRERGVCVGRMTHRMAAAVERALNGLRGTICSGVNNGAVSEDNDFASESVCPILHDAVPEISSFICAAVVNVLWGKFVKSCS